MNNLRLYFISIVLGFLVLFVGLICTAYYAYFVGHGDNLKLAYTLNTKIINYIYLVIFITCIIFLYSLVNITIILVKQTAKNRTRNILLFCLSLLLVGILSYRLIVIYPNDLEKTTELKKQLEQIENDPRWKGFQENWPLLNKEALPPMKQGDK